MTDINSHSSTDQPEQQSSPAQAPCNDDVVELIELLFFAYRDFVSDPDAILQTYGFGRAHHRLLHFIGRNPGMPVAELLDILRITKQSLGRVLRDLIDKGFVYQKEGAHDRRQRLLYLTDEGATLHQQLMAPQIARFSSALEGMGPQARDQAREILFNLINPADREQAARLVAPIRQD